MQKFYFPYTGTCSGHRVTDPIFSENPTILHQVTAYNWGVTVFESHRDEWVVVEYYRHEEKDEQGNPERFYYMCLKGSFDHKFNGSGVIIKPQQQQQQQ